MASTDYTIEDIIKKFEEYTLEHGHPISIHKFCKYTEIKDDDFYKVAGSFERLEKQFWLHQIEQTIANIEAEEVYQGYSAREKLLAFFFTFFENLRKHRSFILMTHKRGKFDIGSFRKLGLLKRRFEDYSNEIIAHAIDNDEVASRKFIDQHYPKGLWIEFAFLINFWMKDDSPDFEETDAAIEKSTNLGFAVMENGVFDSMIDFGRFLYKSIR